VQALAISVANCIVLRSADFHSDHDTERVILHSVLCALPLLAGKRFSADYHQQYLAKNPSGYCGIGGCGVPFKLTELAVGEKA
jgi:peptide methionine sulfoxide reductase MsrA